MQIKIKVKPHSGEQSVQKIFDEENPDAELYLVRLKEFPENGLANLELLKLLKKHFGKEVKIKRGFTSRNKVIEIKD